MNLKNKKAFSMSGWIETAIFACLFVLLFVALIANMNVKYGQNVDGTLGLSSLASNQQQNISDYQNTIQQSVSSGSASSTGLGISLSTTWNIISAGSTLMWNFITGGFIEQIVALTSLPIIVGTFLRILFVISIGLIVLRLILKLKP